MAKPEQPAGPPPPKPLFQRFEELGFDPEGVQALLAESGIAEIGEERGRMWTQVIGAGPELDATKRSRLVKILFDAGVSLRPTTDGRGPLTWLARNEISEDEQLALLCQLLDGGADIDDVAVNLAGEISTLLGEALKHDRPKLVDELLRRGVSAQTKVDALVQLITVCGRPHDEYHARYQDKALDLLAAIRRDGGTIDCRSRGEHGLSPLHAACFAADDVLVAALLETADPNPALANDAKLSVHAATPPKSSMVPQIVLSVGATPRDVAERKLAMLKTRRAAPERKDAYAAPQAREWRAADMTRLEAIIVALRAKGGRLGVPSAAADSGPPPPYKLQIDAALRKLAVAAGADDGAVTTALAALGPSKGSDPCDYLLKTSEPLKNFIDHERLAPKTRLQQLLVDLLSGTPFSGGIPVFTKKDLRVWGEDAYLVSLAHYPRESHKVLKTGKIIAASDADLFVVWKTDDGNTALGHAHPEGFWRRAERFEDFVAEQVDTLVGGPPTGRQAPPAAMPSGSTSAQPR